MTVNGTLTLTTGIITTGSYHAIVGLNGTSSNTGAGYINGTLRRYVASTTTTGDFPVGDANYYTPFSISCAGNTFRKRVFRCINHSCSTTIGFRPEPNEIYQPQMDIIHNGVTGIISYSPGFTFANGDKVGSPATGSLNCANSPYPHGIPPTELLQEIQLLP